MNVLPTDWVLPIEPALEARSDDASPAPVELETAGPPVVWDDAQLLRLPEDAVADPEPDQSDSDAERDRIERLIRARCPELDDIDLDRTFALPPEIAELIMSAIGAIEDKLRELEERVEAST